MTSGGILRIELSTLETGTSNRLLNPDAGPEPWIVLSVSDTGAGIRPDILPHIFEPFFTTKPWGQGAGLGLAQVYGIVTRHGGDIVVDSQPGSGTKISVYFPGVPMDAQPQSTPRPGSESVEKLHTCSDLIGTME